MEETTLAQINPFVAQYSTLVIATEHEGQPFATRIFFVEDPATETACTLYGTLLTNSRKLVNIKQNPHVGIFIGPDQPSTWMEATAYAHVLDEARALALRDKLAPKSPPPAPLISLLATAAGPLTIPLHTIPHL